MHNGDIHSITSSAVILDLRAPPRQRIKFKTVVDARYKVTYVSRQILFADRLLYLLAHRFFYVLVLFFLCFSYSYARQTKLANSLVNFRAHNKIAFDWLIDWSAISDPPVTQNVAPIRDPIQPNRLTTLGSNAYEREMSPPPCHIYGICPPPFFIVWLAAPSADSDAASRNWWGRNRQMIAAVSQLCPEALRDQRSRRIHVA